MRKDICANCSLSIPSRKVPGGRCGIQAAVSCAAAATVFMLVSAGAIVGAAAAALMNVPTSGGSVTASFKLLILFFEGVVAALVSVTVVVTAAASMLLCAATAAAGAFGTVVVREFAYGWIDRRWLHADVCHCGVLCVFWFLHISGLLCVFSSCLFAFRWSAASVGRVTAAKRQLRRVTMPQRQRQHHGWTWVTFLRRQASFRQWDRTKLKVKNVQKHQSSKSLSRTWLERRWWCGGSLGWARCLWSSVKLSRSLVFLALCSTWLVPLVVGFRKMSLWCRVGLGPTPH